VYRSVWASFNIATIPFFRQEMLAVAEMTSYTGSLLYLIQQLSMAIKVSGMGENVSHEAVPVLRDKSWSLSYSSPNPNQGFQSLSDHAVLLQALMVLPVRDMAALCFNQKKFVVN
jgi:hypothetical protein